MNCKTLKRLAGNGAVYVRICKDFEEIDGPPQRSRSTTPEPDTPVESPELPSYMEHFRQVSSISRSKEGPDSTSVSTQHINCPGNQMECLYKTLVSVPHFYLVVIHSSHCPPGGVPSSLMSLLCTSH